MKNEIKTYKTTSDKAPSRACKQFGPWLCIAESKMMLRDDDGNWLDEWQVTEEWQYNGEGWNDDIYQSGTENKRSSLKQRFLAKIWAVIGRK